MLMLCLLAVSISRSRQPDTLQLWRRSGGPETWKPPASASGGSPTPRFPLPTAGEEDELSLGAVGSRFRQPNHCRRAIYGGLRGPDEENMAFFDTTDKNAQSNVHPSFSSSTRWSLCHLVALGGFALCHCGLPTHSRLFLSAFTLSPAPSFPRYSPPLSWLSRSVSPWTLVARYGRTAGETANHIVAFPPHDSGCLPQLPPLATPDFAV